MARGFGYEKEVTVPPTCMVDVYCDNSITDYVRRLRHPVFLKGALIGDGIQEPKIYIKRTMTEKGTIRFRYCVCVCVCVCADS